MQKSACHQPPPGCSKMNAPPCPQPSQRSVMCVPVFGSGLAMFSLWPAVRSQVALGTGLTEVTVDGSEADAHHFGDVFAGADGIWISQCISVIVTSQLQIDVSFTPTTFSIHLADFRVGLGSGVRPEQSD